MAAAVDRFGRIDVLVNNAGNFNAGFFEGLSAEEFRAQIETTFFGPVNVTRAALPVMRAQRSGLVITISSTAGLVGGARRHRQPDQAKRRPRRNLGRRFSCGLKCGLNWPRLVRLSRARWASPRSG